MFQHFKELGADGLPTEAYPDPMCAEQSTIQRPVWGNKRRKMLDEKDNLLACRLLHYFTLLFCFASFCNCNLNLNCIICYEAICYYA